MNDGDVAAMRAVLVGDAGPGVEEIVACEARIRAAQLAADTEALDRLIADELLFTGPDGQLGTKTQDLASHGSGAVRFREHEPEELRVRRVGDDVALSSLRARLVVEVAGTLHRGTYRYTRVWAREGGGPWRVVGGHVSEVRGFSHEATSRDVTLSISLLALLVRDYDEAIAWFVERLGFRLLEDTPMSATKRWVRVAPPGEQPGTALLLARAATPEQAEHVGRQGGGRVFLFLDTDDFVRDYAAFSARGVEFVEGPREEPYGSVAVFRDLYGNRWDLVERRRG